MERKINLKDEGQDLLWFIINEEGIVLEAGPFHNDLYKGAYIPYDCTNNHGIDNEEDDYLPPLFSVGADCPIHHPPHLIHTWLKFKVESVVQLDNQKPTNI